MTRNAAVDVGAPIVRVRRCRLGKAIITLERGKSAELSLIQVSNKHPSVESVKT